MNTKSLRLNITTTSKEKLDVAITDITKKGNRAGRKRAIPKEMNGVVWGILTSGFGYRKTARILREEYGLRLHWSRVRDFKLGRGCYGEAQCV